MLAPDTVEGLRSALTATGQVHDAIVEAWNRHGLSSPEDRLLAGMMSRANDLHNGLRSLLLDHDARLTATPLSSKGSR